MVGYIFGWSGGEIFRCMVLCVIWNVVFCCEWEKVVVYIVSFFLIKGIWVVVCCIIGRKFGILMIRVCGCIKVIDMVVDIVIFDLVEF